MFRVKITEAKFGYQQNANGSVITIGNYDGIHLGHMQLLSRMNQVAEHLGLKRILVTFEPLPKEYFADIKNHQRFSRISLLRDKYRVLKNAGDSIVDELIILHFNYQLATKSADEFIQEILVEQLDVRHVVIGHDFKFGRLASGGIDNFKRFGISVSVVEPHYINQVRVSSSVIREYAGKNELDQLATYLGRNLHYTSRVIHGNHLGRKYGVPTINLCLGRNKPALWGIYVAYVYIDGIRYNAVASIGKNPTVSDLDIYKLEAHLLDIDLNLYGKVATVEILKFLREERKFANFELLFEQIYQDLNDTRKYFNQIQIKGKC